MDRITFCSACGSETAYGRNCEMCGAPLMRKRFDPKLLIRSIPRPTPLGLLVALAVIALAVALFTALGG